VRDPTIEQIFDMLFETMRTEVRALTCTHRDPVAMTKGLSVLRGVYRIMISLGHMEYQPLLDGLQVELDGLGRGVQAMLMRRMSDPGTSPEDREAIEQYFAGEAG
jgi:hypothetical protein